MCSHEPRRGLDPTIFLISSQTPNHFDPFEGSIHCLQLCRQAQTKPHNALAVTDALLPLWLVFSDTERDGSLFSRAMSSSTSIQIPISSDRCRLPSARVRFDDFCWFSFRGPVEDMLDPYSVRDQSKRTKWSQFGHPPAGQDPNVLIIETDSQERVCKLT
jgi:hypothetical protein